MLGCIFSTRFLLQPTSEERTSEVTVLPGDRTQRPTDEPTTTNPTEEPTTKPVAASPTDRPTLIEAVTANSPADGPTLQAHLSVMESAYSNATDSVRKGDEAALNGKRKGSGRQQSWRRESPEARHLAKATKGGTEPVPVELRLVHKECLDKCKGDEAELNGKLKRMNYGHSVIGKMTEKR